jgi:hypothetical protein
MGRFCKTCRFLSADREACKAQCMFWVEFAKTAPRPQMGIWKPTFSPMIVSPRHVWSDLPAHPDIAALGDQTPREDWTETMDCPTWEGRP